MVSGGEGGAGVGDADYRGFLMRARSGGAWLGGVWYADTSKPEYVAALAARDERWRARRARLLPLFEADREDDDR